MKTPKGNLKKGPSRIYHHYDAAFRIWGPDTDIDGLSSVTKLQPSETHRKGDRRGNGQWEDSMWSFRSMRPETSDLEEHLNCLLDVLEPVKEGLLKTTSARSQGIFWCAHYTNAPSGLAGTTILSSKILKRLGDFGFGFAVDTYSDCN